VTHRRPSRLSLILLAEEQVLLGGQAVIEGVMMRAPEMYAVAVRRPGGEIAVMREKVPLLSRRHPVLGWPVIRGAVALVQALALGIKSLNFSAEAAYAEEADEAEAALEKAKKAGKWMWLPSLLLALAMAVGLFFVLPLALTELIRHYWPAMGGGILFNLVDGVIRVIVFLLYLLGISLLKDIRRVFMYHGAEHKVVHAYEAGASFEVEKIQQFSVLHPRCGTSFLVFVMVVAILTFSFLPGDAPLWAKVLPRLALIPLIAGLSYELIRYSARKRDRAFWQVVMAPGLWLQRVTTREPEDDMVEVSIRAFREADPRSKGAPAPA
jgi:uncharacterized protein YqhQ